MSVSDFLKKHKIKVGLVGATVVVATAFGTCEFTPAPVAEPEVTEPAPEDEPEEVVSEETVEEGTDVVVPAEEVTEELPVDPS